MVFWRVPFTLGCMVCLAPFTILAACVAKSATPSAVPPTPPIASDSTGFTVTGSLLAVTDASTGAGCGTLKNCSGEYCGISPTVFVGFGAGLPFNCAMRSSSLMYGVSLELNASI